MKEYFESAAAWRFLYFTRTHFKYLGLLVKDKQLISAFDGEVTPNQFSALCYGDGALGRVAGWGVRSKGGDQGACMGLCKSFYLNWCRLTKTATIPNPLQPLPRLSPRCLPQAQLHKPSWYEVGARELRVGEWLQLPSAWMVQMSAWPQWSRTMPSKASGHNGPFSSAGDVSL